MKHRYILALSVIAGVQYTAVYLFQPFEKQVYSRYISQKQHNLDQIYSEKLVRV
jgi:hypothetical protein